MAEPVNPKHRTWSKQRLFAEAVLRVLDENWSQAEAAKYFGVSRPRLNEHVRLERERRAEAEAPSDEPVGPPPSQGGAGPLGLQERRRVGTFEEFDDYYWGRWQCPDCHRHHDRPKFHSEIMAALEGTDSRLVINMPPYHAKVLAATTPVPTPSGWTTVGDIRPGDEVFDKDGRPCRVVALSEPKECRYRVQLGGPNGPTFLTDDAHRWWVDFRDAKSRFVTTQEVRESKEARRFRVPVQPGLDLPEADLPLDPYLLGAWLGDGTTKSGQITGIDEEVHEAFALVFALGAVHRCTRHYKGLSVVLREVGVLGNKHIPSAYLRSSHGQRLALLQGLMDTDGTVQAVAAGKAASFTNMNERLADGVAELVSSLGWKVRRSKGPAMLNGVDHGPAYRITFCPTRSESPFRLERKTVLLPEVRSRVGHWPFSGVERIDAPVLGRCIAVDSPTQTFLAGRDMVPTGNSTLVTVKHSIYRIVSNPNHRRIIISKSLGFAKEFLHSVDDLLTNPELYLGGPDIIADWGPFKSDSQGETVWNTEKIYVAGRVTPEKDPTIKVLGVGGQIYGSRADDIVADDVATLENQRNPARVGQMLEWFDKEVSSRIGRNGKLIYVGTRVHPGDVYSTLQHRPGYKVLRYPLIRQEPSEHTPAEMLWGDHFDYEMAQVKRAEMRDADFQLVYQNIDVPGLGASFTQEAIDDCKDVTRVVGHYESDWRLIAGLDLAGGNQGSGYTAGVLVAIDLRTGKRFLVDLFNEKSMRAPRLKEKILDWTDQYPIYSWRVENNGLQSNLVQYNEEIVRALAQKGVRIEPHNTQGNKWDPEFGVESIAPLYAAGLISIPWGNAPTCRHFQQLIDQLLVFPMGMVSDLAMAAWFAELGCRDLLKRAHLPMFDSRMKVPERIRRRRVVVNFENQEVTRVPRHLQGEAAFAGTGARGYRRLTVGRPQPHRDFVEPVPPEPTPFVNVAGTVEGDQSAA